MLAAMMRMNCCECQSHLVAYLDNQLPPRLRHRVGQHINTCANCYATYMVQRNVARDLAASLPRIGQPNAPQLGRMWTAVQADMHRPTPVANRQLLTRSGVACVILILVMLLPWSLNQGQIALAVPSLPATPALNDATDTPSNNTEAAVVVALNVTHAAIPAAETPDAATRVPKFD
jgi:anti-sigma factor RsiW